LFPLPKGNKNCARKEGVRARALTPTQRFLQLDPSWFVSGQTTSLFASEAENELVRDARGGIAWRMEAGLAEGEGGQQQQRRNG